jgi:hypothetical protein
VAFCFVLFGKKMRNQPILMKHGDLVTKALFFRVHVYFQICNFGSIEVCRDRVCENPATPQKEPQNESWFGTNPSNVKMVGKPM